MNKLLTTLCLVGSAAAASPALAQPGDFKTTFHVERTPAARLSIETCGRVAAQVARQARLRADVQTFPGQLVVVEGGRAGVGAFVVQCIAVGGTTVSSVTGLDYGSRKGPLALYADQAFAQLRRAIR